MKLKNVVLIGVVASIMAYLNNNLELEENDSRIDELFEEVKAIVAEKLNNFDLEERLAGLDEEVSEDVNKAKEVASEISGNLIKELNEAVDSILNREDKEVSKEDERREELVKELEALLAEVEPSERTKEDEKVFIPKIEPFYLESDDDKVNEYEDKVSVLNVDIPKEIPKIENFVLESDDDNIYYEDSVNILTHDDEEEVSLDDEYLKQIKEAIDKVEDVSSDVLKTTDEEPKEITKDEIDELFSEIINEENSENEDKEEVSDEYLESLLNDLKDAIPEVKEETVDVYAQINELYPYLSRNFIRAVYDLKEAIATEYPLDVKVLVLHRLSFVDLDDLRQFTEIVLHHDYRVNVDEKQTDLVHVPQILSYTCVIPQRSVSASLRYHYSHTEAPRQYPFMKINGCI